MTPPLVAPAPFRRLDLEKNGFIEANGPLYGKREGERLVLGFRVEPRHCNPRNVCHGGMLMTFCDMALALGANFQADLARFLPTVSLTTDFVAPAPLGSWVEGRTDVVRVTRNLVFAQTMVSADGANVVRASGILKLGPVTDPHYSPKRLLGE